MGRTPRDDGSEVIAPTSQGTPRTVVNPRSRREAWKRFSPGAFRESIALATT